MHDKRSKYQQEGLMFMGHKQKRLLFDRLQARRGLGQSTRASQHWDRWWKHRNQWWIDAPAPNRLQHRFLSCLNQYNLLTEDILLFVQGRTSCYEMPGTQTEPIVLDFIFVNWGQISPVAFLWCFSADLLWHLRSGVSLFSVPSFGTDLEIWSNCGIWKKESSVREVSEDPTATLAELQRSCLQMVEGYRRSAVNAVFHQSDP